MPFWAWREVQRQLQNTQDLRPLSMYLCDISIGLVIQDLLDLEPDQKRDMLNLHARFLQKLEDNRIKRRELCVGLQQVCIYTSLQSVRDKQEGASLLCSHTIAAILFHRFSSGCHHKSHQR